MAWTYFLGNYIERLTGGGRVIDTDHGYIHQGIGYKAYLEVGDMSDVTNVIYTLKTPPDLYIHFKNMQLIALGGSVKVSIRRGTTDNPISFTGTEESPNDGSAPTELTGPSNLNDNSAKTTGTVIKKTPTFDDNEDGEDWAIIQVVGDATNQYTSVSSTQDNPNEELVMKPDTYYVIKVEKESDAPDNVLLTMFWYEEGGGLA